MSILRPTLLGGVDGVITSFAIVAAADAGALSRRVVLLIGLSSVAADGLSMGISEYLSSAAEGGANRPARQGLACFAAFVACGVVPTVLYAALGGRLLAVAMFSLVELMLLGWGRALASGEPILTGLGQTAALGAAAGAVAYGIGRMVDAYDS